MVLGLLRDLARGRGLAVLVALHQPGLAAQFADRRLRLEDGRISEA
jgi:phosphonate transport system ATP-binding protein